MSLISPDGEALISRNTEAERTLARLPSFTLGECVVIHTALLVTREHLKQNRLTIIADNGKDAYNAMWNDAHSATIKLAAMVADAMDTREESAAQEVIKQAQQLIEGESNEPE